MACTEQANACGFNSTGRSTAYSKEHNNWQGSVELTVFPCLCHTKSKKLGQHLVSYNPNKQSGTFLMCSKLNFTKLYCLSIKQAIVESSGQKTKHWTNN